MKKLQTPGYPYPNRGQDEAQDAYRDAMAYDAACDSWARKLSEANLRSFEVEFIRGSREPDAIDAHIEYIRRESLGQLSHQKEERLKASKGRKGRSSKR